RREKELTCGGVSEMHKHDNVSRSAYYHIAFLSY
ncbi:lysis protein, partial [Salmonella enterica subsp. enterica]|nr:lysis protein [Salmonella enterica subsp. enterica serovar Give]EEG6051417.1 lysis protein [Salmonella enterica subsp. enterica]